MINLLIGERELRFVVHLSPFVHVGLGLRHSCSCLGMYLSSASSAFGGSELQVAQSRICDLRKSGSDLKAKAVLRNHIGGLVWRLRTSGQACQTLSGLSVVSDNKKQKNQPNPTPVWRAKIRTSYEYK